MALRLLIVLLIVFLGFNSVVYGTTRGLSITPYWLSSDENDLGHDYMYHTLEISCGEEPYRPTNIKRYKPRDENLGECPATDLDYYRRHNNTYIPGRYGLKRMPKIWTELKEGGIHTMLPLIYGDDGWVKAYSEKDDLTDVNF